MLQDLTSSLWPAGPLPSICAFLDTVVVERDLDRFVFNPILCPNSVRVSVGDSLAPETWRRVVMTHWSSREIDSFLSEAPASARRMIDTDGSARAVLYLDDLHLASHQLLDHPDGDIMCATLEVPSGRRGFLTLCDKPREALAETALATPFNRLWDAGARGMWALRWCDRQPIGALWISEAVHNSSIEHARAVADSLACPAWPEVDRVTSMHSWLAYPDGIELRIDGSYDLTVGFQRPERARAAGSKTGAM